MTSKNTVNNRKANNLCVKCGKRPPNKNINNCEECRIDMVNRTKERKKKLISQGLCERCGVNKLINKRFCESCYNKHKISALKCYSRDRDILYEKYGGYTCKCCGETEKAFLTIDHINGGGSKHRKEVGQSNIYRWLKQNNYPEGFQVLCMNCQWGKKNCGICPHQK